ncbi:RxLR effector protein [Phytophthora megakarya]|uniref:RxLR effector protein n=1 Tax=Phytophthora megakarya TaxID=4795 RepID=A0A225UQW0_9STRA|nr:RxLR effector protein [Phytophthora megakarya]
MHFRYVLLIVTTVLFASPDIAVGKQSMATAQSSLIDGGIPKRFLRSHKLSEDNENEERGNTRNAIIIKMGDWLEEGLAPNDQAASSANG